MQEPNKTNPVRNVLSVILYILAGVVLLAGVLLAISFFNAPNAFFAAQIAFQGPIFQAFFKQIFQLLREIGVALLLISLLFSAALVGLGRVAAQNTRLKARVAELEARLNDGQPRPPSEP